MYQLYLIPLRLSTTICFVEIRKKLWSGFFSYLSIMIVICHIYPEYWDAFLLTILVQ